jgi:hypothetical protein
LSRQIQASPEDERRRAAGVRSELALANDQGCPIGLDLRNAQDHASFMNLLPVGDGSTYIDLSEAQRFDIRGVKYFRSEHGVWVRKDASNLTGQVMPEREVFKAFMGAHRFTEAKEHFPGLFENGYRVAVAIDEDAESSDPIPLPTRWGNAKTRTLLRFAVGGLATLLLAAYAAAVITGKISESRQLSTVDLIIIVVGVIAIGILIKPEILNSIQEFGIGGLSVKMRHQLQEIQDTQKDHSKNLNDMRFILEALATTSEISHLKKLAYGATSEYKRNPSLIAELRRLRDVGLIKPINKQRIGHLPDRFNLAECVELTKRGADYLHRMEEVEPPSDVSTSPNRESR